ncbi:MAG: hypothetical protein Kow0025_07130 [Thermodesulfovibrionales bacterium]
MARIAAQISIGLMLLFGTATLVPRGLVLVRTGRRARGWLYVFLGLLLLFLAVLSFAYAYWTYREG